MPPCSPTQVSIHAKRILPSLEPLGKNLKALSLGNNRFTRLPDCLLKLTALEVLDFNGEPHTPLCSLPFPLHTPLRLARCQLL